MVRVVVFQLGEGGDLRKDQFFIIILVQQQQYLHHLLEVQLNQKELIFMIHLPKLSLNPLVIF